MKVSLNDEVGAVVEQFAKREGMEAGAAADRLIEIGVSRLNALKRYAKNQKKKKVAEAPPAPKAPAKRKPKKVKEPEVEVTEATEGEDTAADE